MREDDKLDTIERYRSRFQQFGYSPLTLGWNKGRQAVRFQAALQCLDPNDFATVLDYGCGFGDLFGFLSSGGWHGDYTGVDIVPELIEEGRVRWASARAHFLCLTHDTPDDIPPADLAVAIGVFNHKLKSSNDEFIAQTLDVLWKLSRKVVVLDFMSTVADIRYDHLHYADPAEIYRLCSKYSKRIQIEHSYMPFEFMVKIWHDDSFDSAAPVFAPYKSLV